MSNDTAKSDRRSPTPSLLGMDESSYEENSSLSDNDKRSAKGREDTDICTSVAVARVEYRIERDAHGDFLFKGGIRPDKGEALL